jgi:hypothetical protein
MPESKKKNSRGFKISQYVFATFMGLLAAKLAPSHEELPPEAIAFVIPDHLREAFSPWWDLDKFWRISPDQNLLTFNVPWVRYETGPQGYWHTLTRDHFRCKGKAAHGPIALSDGSYLFDCWGYDHGLPWIEDREFVEPLLIDLLNGLQRELKSSVVILSGHRCPIHHRYLTQGQGSSTDKHLIAAAVDFRLQGYENTPAESVQAIQKIFRSLSEDPKAKLVTTPEGWENYFCDLKWHPAGTAVSLDHPPEYGYFELILSHRLDMKTIKFIPKESYRLPQF